MPENQSFLITRVFPYIILNLNHSWNAATQKRKYHVKYEEPLSEAAFKNVFEKTCMSFFEKEKVTPEKPSSRIVTLIMLHPLYSQYLVDVSLD